MFAFKSLLLCLLSLGLLADCKSHQLGYRAFDTDGDTSSASAVSTKAASTTRDLPPYPTITSGLSSNYSSKSNFSIPSNSSYSKSPSTLSSSESSSEPTSKPSKIPKFVPRFVLPRPRYPHRRNESTGYTNSTIYSNSTGFSNSTVTATTLKTSIRSATLDSSTTDATTTHDGPIATM